GDIDTVHDNMQNAAGAVSRMAYLHLPEAMMATGILKDAATTVGYQELIKDSGIVIGGFAGLIGTKDFYRTLDPVSKKILLTGGITALVLFLSGCVDKSGSNPIPAETDAPDHTEEPIAEPTQEPTPIETPVETQHLYDLNHGYVKIVLEADENLFGIKIEGSMVDGDKAGWETIRDDNENIIFNRETYTPSNFDLYGEIWPNQARALEEQYGSMVSLTIEQIDTDGGGMDKVAVQFVGSEGIGELITDYDGFDGVGHYLSLGIYHNLFK
ncbi:MAG: hypothetical protein KAS11_03425, partial [Candidatus Aenigmarchaeota archaeon]|nr:hypothetical protein [Candidatus Aenigmarchaeota archaeon]